MSDEAVVRLAVDAALFTVCDAHLAVLLVRRGITPYRGRWALPGARALEAGVHDAGGVGPAPDLANFRRKVLSTPQFVRESGDGPDRTGPGRPATRYRRGKATSLHPPLLRA